MNNILNRQYAYPIRLLLKLIRQIQINLYLFLVCFLLLAQELYLIYQFYLEKIPLFFDLLQE
ncbi:Uncharacterised protein [Chlamydia trachomatis]|nr:Uncharacterised protein [Chlamydia trachomatis]CRH47437.1 Uncharacterised protein [Chlamydia trachomatis]